VPGAQQPTVVTARHQSPAGLLVELQGRLVLPSDAQIGGEAGGGGQGVRVVLAELGAVPHPLQRVRGQLPGLLVAAEGA
jgi:hypothetical protein